MASSRVYSLAHAVILFIMVTGAVFLSPGLVSLGHAQRVATTGVEHARESQRITVDVENMPLLSVLDTIARQAGLVLVFSKTVIPASTRVTLHLRNVSASEAFQQALRSTGLVANVHPTGDVTIFRDEDPADAAGTIAGNVVDARTKQPLHRARVSLDGVQRAETKENGAYQIPAVSAGRHILTVKLLGYTKAERSVTVLENASVDVNVTLEPTATPLDQVVVTGTVIPTERKAVPNAITVITAKQIEERGITKIDQLFRGDIPGLFAQNRGSNALLDQVAMFSRGATTLGVIDARTDELTQFSNPIKTYVDGVEMADPRYLSQIDPKSIERIEILTGPQASTIYGSNAINGVMQVFTKRGVASRPQVNLSLLSGWVQNNFSRAHTPEHDYNAQLNSSDGQVSYNIGGSWNYIGPWTPAKQTVRVSAFGGARIEIPTMLGRVTTDVTLRRGSTQNVQHGSEYQPYTISQTNGRYGTVQTGSVTHTVNALDGQTLGLTFRYAPTSWWSHEIGTGVDNSDSEQRNTKRGYSNTSDTTLRLQQEHSTRRSLRYTSTVQAAVSSFANATVTAGVDGWQTVASNFIFAPQVLTGTLINSIISPTNNGTVVTRRTEHNAGAFFQSQMGFYDHVFLTYGVRAEWNPGFGAETQPNYAPRYGIAWTHEMGIVTAKLRGSYGRSTRPPIASYKRGMTASQAFSSNWRYYSSVYPDFDYLLANPELTPEHQQGIEGGLELYVGTRGSLVITRYDQTVDGLISLVQVDSARSLIQDPYHQCSLDPRYCGYQYLSVNQYLNTASIRNQGWELQGSWRLGPLTARGTYSWTKSRSLGVAAKYQAQFPAISYPEYQPGATFQYVPEHTWAWAVTYSEAASTVSLNVMGVGRVRGRENDFYLDNVYYGIRLPQDRLTFNSDSYTSITPGYATADLNASHQFASRLEAVLQVQNLTDRYTNDFSSLFASIGRQTRFGLRCRL